LFNTHMYYPYFNAEDSYNKTSFLIKSLIPYPLLTEFTKNRD
jgi:hypothetical protein